MTMRRRSSVRVSVWRLALLSAALAVALVVVSGCGGDEEPDADTGPAATVTQTADTPPDETGTATTEATAPTAGTPTQEAEVPAAEAAPPCPVSTEVCQLAVEFVPAIENADGDAIADRATPQQLSCPASVPAPDDVFGNALATPCAGEEPGAMIEVYEFHNGKGPFYYTDAAEYAPQVREALGSTFSGQPPSVVVVGCGTEDSNSPPDCEQAAVVVYSNGDPVTPLFAALVFTQALETPEWRVEKLWSPFPGVIPTLMPESLEVGIYTVGGVQALELTPYSLN